MEDIGLLPKPTNDPPVRRPTVTEANALHHISTGKYEAKQHHPDARLGYQLGKVGPRCTPYDYLFQLLYSSCTDVSCVSWENIKHIESQQVHSK